MVLFRFVGLDCSIISHPKVWEASGHVAGFADPMVDCKKCKSRFRADQVAEATCPLKPSKRPGECGGELTEPRALAVATATRLEALPDVPRFAADPKQSGSFIFSAACIDLLLGSPRSTGDESQQRAWESIVERLSETANFKFSTFCRIRNVKSGPKDLRP